MVASARQQFQWKRFAGYARLPLTQAHQLRPFSGDFPVTRFIYLAPTVLFLFGSVACSGEDEGTRRAQGNNNGNGNGNGDGTGGGGLLPGGDGDGDGSMLDPGGGDGGGDDCGAVLPVTFRDFRGQGEPGGHDDFEISAHPQKKHENEPYLGWNDLGCGMVNPTLGADGKPTLFTGPADTGDTGIQVPVGAGYQQRVVNGPDCWSEANPNPNPAGTCFIGICQTWAITPPSFGEIHNASTFAQWFTDVPGVNETIEDELVLVEDPPGSGIQVYDSNAFFPIDGRGFGNTAGQQHNYHFTTEIHVQFTYVAGQKFTFRGDDDLWIFVNGKLALDVGGLHQALTGTIDFDLQAAELGIEPGKSYPMAIFHAERQTDASNFRIETNIKCFEPVVVR